MPATNEMVVDAESSPSRDVHHCENCGQPIITVPMLRCADCGATTQLRCFVRRSNVCYIAECIDLDISAEAATPEGAITGLQDALDGYMGVVFGTNTSGLILRPSPWLHRMRYHLEYAKELAGALVSRHQFRSEMFYAIAVPSHCHM